MGNSSSSTESLNDDGSNKDQQYVFNETNNKKYQSLVSYTNSLSSGVETTTQSSCSSLSLDHRKLYQIVNDYHEGIQNNDNYDDDDNDSDSEDESIIYQSVEDISDNDSDDGAHTISSFELIDPYLVNQQNGYSRPHSVLGLSDQQSDNDDNQKQIKLSMMNEYNPSISPPLMFSYKINYLKNGTNPNEILVDDTNDREEDDNRRKPNGIRLPVPRSKSFHQILRSTQNGKILASKGTIRGAAAIINQDSQTNKSIYQNNHDFVDNIDNNKKSDHLELNNFLFIKRNQLRPIQLSNDRLCQSEINLNHQFHQNNNANNDDIHNKKIMERQPPNESNKNANDQLDFDLHYSFKLPTYQYGSNAAISNGPMNGVAAKIQRIKQQHKNLQILKLNQSDSDKNTLKVRCKRNQKNNSAMMNDSQEEIVKNIKIKRSVSNFDSNYFGKMKMKNHSNSLLFMDNPWKLKRPEQDKNNTNLLAQYLSFEFLNERIHNRLQQEFGYLPNNGWKYLELDETSTTTTKSDMKQPVIKSELISKNFSCSEMNLSTANKQNSVIKSTEKTDRNKRKSFKKFLEHYFVNESNVNRSNTSVSSEELLAGFDQNFILKRNTPNAGLSENDRYRHSIWKHCYEQNSNYSLRSWKKNREMSSLSSSTLNNSKMISTIDKQLEMMANLFNQCCTNLEDTDYLSVSKHFISDTTEPLNYEISFLPEEFEYLDTFRKINGEKKNRCRKNSRKQKLRINNLNKDNDYLYWTPSNDLSSESDFTDDDIEDDNSNCDDYNDNGNDCFENIIEETIANIEVEDFVNGHIYEDIDNRLLKRRRYSTNRLRSNNNQQNNNNHNDNNANINASQLNTNNRVNRKHNAIPNEPCFTLSNQLKTLLHNSNRLKSHYFYY